MTKRMATVLEMADHRRKLAAAARRKQVREIEEKAKELVERKCKCGCELKFRVLPTSIHIYGSRWCAIQSGFKFKNAFNDDGAHSVRRWIIPDMGITADVEKTW